MRRFTSNLFAFSTITHIRGSITSPTQSPSLLTLAASNSAACTSAPLQLTVLISSFSQRRSTRLRTGSASSAILITKYPTTHLDHPPAQHLHPLPSKLRQLRPLRALRMVRRSQYPPLYPDDVARFMYENRISTATLGGHGIGGKVALAAACYHFDKTTGYFGLDSSPMDQFYH